MAGSIPTGTGFHLGGGGGGGSTDALAVYASGVAGEALVVGDVLRFDRSGGVNAGRLLKAQALSASSGVAADVVGVAKTAAAGAGLAVEYYLAGGVACAMDAAPAATDNGARVYLSETTAGKAALIAPSGAGEAVVLVGFLTGADGATITPEIVLRPGIIALL